MAHHSSERWALAKRLFVAALLSVAIALVCWLLLPRAGMYVPWYVPVVAFVIIAITAVMRVNEIGDDDGDEEDENPPDVAGRIGDSEYDV
jgi:hypothetical protein